MADKRFTAPTDPNDKWQWRLYHARKAGGITQSQYNTLSALKDQDAAMKARTDSANGDKVIQSINSLATWEKAELERQKTTREAAMAASVELPAEPPMGAPGDGQ